MGWYFITFVFGACLGGAGIGFLMWNYHATIRAKLAVLESSLTALRAPR